MSKPSAHYRKGIMATDKGSIEFYATVLNDLAEGIDMAHRVTAENLAEVVGHLNMEHTRMHARLSALRLSLQTAMLHDAVMENSPLPGQESQRRARKSV